MLSQEYELLALAFSYPDQQLLETIHSGIFDRYFTAEVPQPGCLEDLEVEYCRLFVGPGHVEVPPYESVYRHNSHPLQQGCVMGSACVDVRRLYQEAGLMLNPGFSEMEDHIAVETIFMAYLLEQGEQEPQSPYRKQATHFLQDHLQEWAPVFAAQVEARTRHPWYAFVARELGQLVKRPTISQ